MKIILWMFGIITLLQPFDHKMYSQQYLDDIAIVLEPKIQLLYNTQYELHVVEVVDSSLNQNTFPAGPIEDTFGTLHDCAIFTAQNLDRAFIGIFKSGNIIWHSDTIINVINSNQHSIVAITDINNDGKIDIITSWLQGVRMTEEDLWIFSWDGTNGTIISDYDGKNQSVIGSYVGLFTLVDVDADGIFEIQGIINPNTDKEEIITYTWNNQKYSNWPNPPRPLPSGYMPKNRLDVNVKADVKKNDGLNYYHYCIENKTSSIQKIGRFILPQFTDSALKILTPQNWSFGSLRKQLFGWQNDPIDPNPIPKNTVESNFEFKSHGIPSLLTFYIQGDNYWYGQPDMNIQTLQINEEIWYQDIVNNSISGATIGPSNPPTPFIQTNFLDTLSSYTSRSRSLDWIKDQPTADKYLGYFASAKTSLQIKDTTSARITLQQVLNDVDIDSTNNIRSEAYALLRFNTEYLLEHLSDPVVLSISPTSVIAGYEPFTLTVNGANFKNGSEVYWKSSARTTTFVADTVLQASILASDVAVIDVPTITVRNPDGTESNGVRFYYEGTPVVITMNKYWNMISVPLLQSNYNADAVFPGISGGIGYNCNNATQTYEISEILRCGLGYWAYYENPAAVTISGLIADSLIITVTQRGWVMLGSRDTPVEISSLVLTNGASISGGTVYGYYAGQGYVPITTVINPGQGVWAYIEGATMWPCTITIP